MFLGLFPDGGTDGNQQLFVRRATAQQSFQVTSGLTGKAGAQKALTGQPHPVAGGAELAVDSGNEADVPFPARHGVIDRRTIAQRGTRGPGQRGKAVDAVARQPEADSKISKNLLLGCALAEATAIYGMVVAILIIFLCK